MDRSTNYVNQGWRCPDCGKVNPGDAGFCTGCGRRMPQPANAGYQDPRNTGYYDPANTGYADPRNTGYTDPRNTGYVDPRNTGYYDPRDTGYYDPSGYNGNGGLCGF